MVLARILQSVLRSVIGRQLVAFPVGVFFFFPLWMSVMMHLCCVGDTWPFFKGV